MSTKDRFSIYGLGLLIIIVLILIWLNVISYYIPFKQGELCLKTVSISTFILTLSILFFINLFHIIDKAIVKHNMSDNTYKDIFNSTELGIIIVNFDGSKILKTNPKMLEMIGYDDFTDLQNHSIYDIWANPDDRLYFMKEMQNRRRISAYPFQGIDREGRHKRYELYSVYNIKLNRIESIAVDVTQKHNIAEKLAFQATILENIHESIIVIDLEGIIQFYNKQAQKIFKISEDTLLPDILKIISPEHNLHAAGQIQDLVLSGESWQGEYHITIDGQKKIFMNRIDPVVYQNETTAIVIMSTDITELMQTREQAKAASLAKNQFLANMSHEIRTPMIGILGAVDLLEQKSMDKKQVENINIIRECGEDLLSIINDILDVSKIEIGLVDLHPENCNIYDLFSRTINMVEPAIQEKGLKLELDLNAISSVEVFLDHFKLRQILTNILFNAIKFTSQGTIKLKASIEGADESQLVIIISDTGIGIPNESLDHIFNPFSQVDTSFSRSFGGTGLGLYICKKLIDLMEGEINVKSEINFGTEFHIRIPIEIIRKHDNSEQSPYSSNQIAENIVFIPRSILVVEDNELNQKIVCEMLRNFGFAVFTANNGLECLQLLQEGNNFDLILLDMQMPIMDGYETAKIIRENYQMQDIPIIAMTAHAMTGDRELCIASGCSSYIAKPFKSEELVAEINQQLPQKANGSNHLLNNLFVNQLLPEFFEILYEMMQKLNNAIAAHDLNEVKSISHDIKGTSGLYGFSNISNLAEQVGKAAASKSLSSTKALIEEMQQLYHKAVQEVS